MATPWASDALWAGSAIVQRLKDQVPALRLVGQVDAFTGNTDVPPQMPAALVLLQDMRVTARSAVRADVATEQDWIVALAVRSASPVDAANADALGALIPRVVGALQGWAPAGGLRQLAWVNGPRPNYGRNVCWFPLQFTLQVTATLKG